MPSSWWVHLSELFSFFQSSKLFFSLRQHLSAQRSKWCESLMEFLQAATDQLLWLSEKENVELIRDWTSKDLNVEVLSDYARVRIIIRRVYWKNKNSPNNDRRRKWTNYNNKHQTVSLTVENSPAKMYSNMYSLQFLHYIRSYHTKLKHPKMNALTFRSVLTCSGWAGMFYPRGTGGGLLMHDWT